MNSILSPRFVEPAVVATHFHLGAGDVVGDFGAGSGYFTGVLSAAVGPTGRVYAVEIQKVLVEKLGAQVRSHGYSNVDVLWCDLESPRGIRLNDSQLDVGIMVNTFFQLEEKGVAIAELHRVLKPGGMMYVIDWTESFGGLGPTPETIVSQAETIDYFETGKFVLEREYPAGEHHYGLAFRSV
jgi:predicted methyltransferase